MLVRSFRLAILVITAAGISLWAQESKLSEEQMRDFLLNAKVVSSKQTSKGVTAPYKLTMTDGTITHDAVFQSINESKQKMEFSDGRTEMNFVDSYKYDIAAYELAKLLGLADMMPVTVERKWSGKTGALVWWIDTLMDEEKRLKQKVQPPDPEAWNKEMYKMRVFAELVYDTDRNLGNVLISPDWKLYMIDYTRAFRLYYDIRTPKNLTKCDRKLLEKLRALNIDELTEKTKLYLRKPEIKAVMMRRDKIVALFEKMVAAQGESAVLY